MRTRYHLLFAIRDLGRWLLARSGRAWCPTHRRIFRERCVQCLCNDRTERMHALGNQIRQDIAAEFANNQFSPLPRQSVFDSTTPPLSEGVTRD